MNIIIDTHIFLWLLAEPEKITHQHISYLEDTMNNVYLSAMSIAEIAIKKSLGKLEFSYNAMEMASQMEIEILSFSGEDACLLETLPYHHKDPFDRMILAQALSNDYFVLSLDRKFQHYGCKLL